MYNQTHFQPTTVVQFPRALHSSFAKHVAGIQEAFEVSHRVLLGYLPLSIHRTAKQLWRWNKPLIEGSISARASLRLAPCAKVTMSLRPYRYIP
jgi:hypothetical protein